jgi:hypothetical protein
VNAPDLALDGLLTDDERRLRVSVEAHAKFRQSLAAPIGDELDDELDEHIVCDPYSGDPPSRRKDSEVSRMLSILDNLERGDA